MTVCWNERRGLGGGIPWGGGAATLRRGTIYIYIYIYMGSFKLRDLL